MNDSPKNWPGDRFPVFVECGCCDHYHRPEFAGDCRNDSERFSTSDLEDRYGPDLRGCLMCAIEQGESVS